MLDKKNIPVFILAGGLGTRLSEETHLKPKPMIEIGEIPILVHIMRWYYSFGFNDFVVCAGYRAWEIKQYFLTYEFRRNHLSIDHRENVNTQPTTLGKNDSQERWRVRVIDTGLNAMTGSRVAQAIDVVSKTDAFDHFALTYGDGLTNASIENELQFHLAHGKIGTVLGVQPMARFGELEVGEGELVKSFLEKPQSESGLISGGFFIFKKDFRAYLSTGENCILERQPLMKLAADEGLAVFRHAGFWHPMDALRDKTYLQSLWDSGSAPWLSQTS